LKNNSITIFVPDFPPHIDGIGDYAYLLAKQLKKNTDTNIEFIVAGNTTYPFKEYDGFKVYFLQEKTSNALLELLQSIPVSILHLHYVGYGYAKRGAPFWLYKGLQKWRHNEEYILITTFHELYAKTIKPWTSSFWNQWFQKWVCKKIFLISEYSISSRIAYAQRLQKFSLTKKITTLPVFSNLQELNSPIALGERKKQLVILGSAASRSNIYIKYSYVIDDICNKFQFLSIIDIGPLCKSLPRLKTPIIEMGILKAEEISAILSNSYAGLMGAYSSNYFAKSGVFAAFTAHAVLVIALETSIQEQDGILANHHFITKETSELKFEAISKAGYDWYEQHSLQKHGEIYNTIFLTYIHNQ